MDILPITGYVRLVQMNVARTEHVLRQIEPLADDFGDDALADLIRNGMVTCRVVADLAAERRGQSESRSDDGDDEFDKSADADMRRLIKAIRDTSDWMQRTRHSLRSRVKRLVATHCPVGPGDIISQRYEEQLHRTRALIADLRGPSADLVAPLECEQKLRAVEASVRPYEEALAARQRVSADDVRAAAREMHEKTAVLVAYIIGVYASQPSRMQALMLPVADQQARVRAILKARRSGQSVGDDPSRDDDDPLLGDGLDDDGLDGGFEDGLDGGLDDIDGLLDDAELDGPAADAGIEAAPVDDGRAEGPAGAEAADPERPAPGPLGGNPAVNLPIFGADGGEG